MTARILASAVAAVAVAAIGAASAGVAPVAMASTGPAGGQGQSVMRTLLYPLSPADDDEVDQWNKKYEAHIARKLPNVDEQLDLYLDHETFFDQRLENRQLQFALVPDGPYADNINESEWESLRQQELRQQEEELQQQRAGLDYSIPQQSEQESEDMSTQ
jgi:hypothetical protein